MYKNVLLTDREIALLKRVVGDYLHEKLTPERQNLTIILNRLRGIKPTIQYNQSINQYKWERNGTEIKELGFFWAGIPRI